MRHLMRVAAAALLLTLTAAPALAKSYFAERFDAIVRVLPGGSLEVTETVAFRFESGSFDHVYRELPTRRTDGIQVVSASMDARPFPIGKGPGAVEVSGNNKVRVEWRFEPVHDSTHVFVLTYVARGVVTQAADADVLAWRALPSDHDYRIAASTITFVLTEGTTGEQATPVTTEIHRVDGDVTRALGREEDSVPSPLHSIIEASGIRSNGWIEPTYRLARGSLVSAPPDWQRASMEAAASAPRWGTAAAVVVLAGLVLLFGLRQQYDAPSVDLSPASSGGTVPDALPPGLVGPLVSNGSLRLEHAIAVIFSLAERGVVSIDEHKGRFGIQSFDITRQPSKAALAGHERTLLGLLFDQSHPDRISLGSARGRLARRFKLFRGAVYEDLRQQGLVSPDRKRIRDRFVALGIILLVGSGLAVPAAAVFVSRFEGWPMLIPGALAVVAIASFIAAASVTPLSNEGIRRASRWRAFRAYLKEISQGRDSRRDLGALLPFAVATGLTHNWSRYIRKHPGTVPAWFRALSNASQDWAFVAFMSSAGAHGGTTGGGGGAAGGGASGAG